MIYIADVVKADILKLNKKIMNYKMTIYDLEGFDITNTQRFMKANCIRKVFDLRKKEKRLQRKLDFLINGSGLQTTWNGYKE